MEFKRARREKAKLRLALAGPSGSGKTYSALLLAKGLGGRVAVVDTERGSASLYADNPKIGLAFDVLDLAPPYRPERYVEAIRSAQRAGYSVVIVDSLTHAWSGEGGILDMVDLASKSYRGNKFAGWKDIAPAEKQFLDALTGTDIHIIATIRTKTAWEVQEENGRKKPVKVGLKPEQREGLEYEFTCVLDLSVDGHVATASKDRTDLFTGRHFVPDPDTGRQLLAWLNSGEAASPQVSTTPPSNRQNQPPANQPVAPAANRQTQPPADQAAPQGQPQTPPPAQAPAEDPRKKLVRELGGMILFIVTQEHKQAYSPEDKTAAAQWLAGQTAGKALVELSLEELQTLGPRVVQAYNDAQPPAGPEEEF